MSVRSTHGKVRTLTCLARKLSLASRLEHTNQTNNSRRWPSVPCFPWLASQNQAMQTRTTGSWSWLRFAVPPRIAHPWIPMNREEGVAGTIARYRSLAGSVLLPRHKPCGGTTVSSVPQPAKARSAHQPPPRNLHGNGFPIHAEPSNNIKPAAQGQVFLSKFRSN